MKGDYMRTPLHKGAIIGESLDWMSIEIAPRDGTPVDLWHRQGFRVTEQWWDKDDQCWVPEVRDDSDFSHWRPIPPGPTARA